PSTKAFTSTTATPCAHRSRQSTAAPHSLSVCRRLAPAEESPGSHRQSAAPCPSSPSAPPAASRVPAVYTTAPANPAKRQSSISETRSEEHTSELQSHL